MLMLLAAPLMIVAQAVAATPPAVVYVPPPAPPPAPQPGSALYAEQRASREASLRRSCYSETAIKMILEREDAARAPNPADRAREKAILTELAAAADAEPVDLGRLEAAHTAWRAFQDELEVRRDRQSFDLLRRLPPADRTLYARGFALYTRFPPRRAPTCGVAPQVPRERFAPPPIKVPPAPKK